ncbi:ABC transporter permease [Nonomuraea mesophila]|uniref:ABC transporter permease n=1 Tax=Nonomuraea mesophila TaxID=2530382 RepID=A0A4R5F9D9_9ACTN|nr:ABC transporter permease [Nonomuraea mesophila]TDE45180.1 ABC transporter permease [Nonomuraea mesophila]
MTNTVVSRRTAAAAGGGALTGTGAMLRLALRKDRVKLPAWTLGITLFLPYFAAVVARTNPTPEALAASTEMINIPMLRLFSGPMFGMENPTTLGYLVNVYLPEFLLGAALMNMLLVARHTRAEEQSGRAELVRAAVVGRHAALTAALLVAVITNAVLALLLTAAALGVGMTVSGALLFGAATAAMGLVFAAVTAVSAQLTEQARAAAGIAGGVLAVVWLLRAVGAVQGGWLIWTSPMGWAQLTRVAGDGRWWPLALPVLLSAALTAVAYALSGRRDLGAGLVASRPGRARAARGLRSPFALAFRLQRASILWWGGSLLAAGLVFGGLTGSMREGMVEEFLGGGPDVVGGYLSLMAVGMVFLVGIFTVLAATRLRTDERRGRVAPLLATPTGRWAWLGSSLLATGLAAVALLAVSGLSMGVGTALALGDAAWGTAAAAAVLARIPEILFLLGVAATLFGLAPRGAALAWAVLALGAVIRFWGADLPGWARGLSPFDHIPRMPVEDFSLAPLVMLTALAACLLLIGLYGFRRRDLDGS